MVTSGTCKVIGDCVTSPKFPSNYGNREACTITAPSTPLRVERFITEVYFDRLRVNGKVYVGGVGPDGVTPNRPITWTTVGGIVNPGWKLCITDVFINVRIEYSVCPSSWF